MRTKATKKSIISNCKRYIRKGTKAKIENLQEETINDSEITLQVENTRESERKKRSEKNCKYSDWYWWWERNDKNTKSQTIRTQKRMEPDRMTCESTDRTCGGRSSWNGKALLRPWRDGTEEETKREDNKTEFNCVIAGGVIEQEMLEWRKNETPLSSYLSFSLRLGNEDSSEFFIRLIKSSFLFFLLVFVYEM